MLHRVRKLRLRRYIRMRQHQVVSIGEQTDEHFFSRFDRLLHVRRFVAAWVALIILLISCSVAQIQSLGHYYQTLQPAPGGMYTEGVMGAFTNANPMYATTLVDRSVAQLLFNGLMTYDENNELVGDLAEGWSSDARGQVYTVVLKPNITWHDGQPFTSDDVVFTYNAIQNPDTQSPLNQSWQNVKVEATDDRTVKFTLTNPLASFPYSLTNGIVPQHILGSTAMADLRSSSFNTNNPIGTGPFKWQEVAVLGDTSDTREELITLAANDDYHFGEPKLHNFAIHAFRNESSMVTSYNNREVQAMVGLNQEPADVQEQMSYVEFTQTAAVMAFFKTTAQQFTEKPVRQALVKAVDTSAVRDQLGYAARPVHQPLLKTQVGYNKEHAQFSYDVVGAQSLLVNAGYSAGPKGILQKNGQPLAFTITTENTPENTRAAKNLQQQWRKIGADVQLSLLSASELQVGLATHDYDVLLRGVSMGIDPDVYVYWHSSQADIASQGRLNFSEYNSSTTDAALESGRTRTDNTLRAAKYQPFLTAWKEDAPALGLYQPRFLYITRQPVYGLDARTINNASDRFTDVHEWMIRRVNAPIQ